MIKSLNDWYGYTKAIVYKHVFDGNENDIVQEAMIEIAKHCTVDHPKLFYIKIIHNKIYQYFRYIHAQKRDRRVERCDSSFGGYTNGTTPLHLLLHGELRCQIQDIVDKFPSDKWRVCWEAWRDSRSYQEVADELGISYTFVCNLASRARARVRKQLKEIENANI